MKLHSLDGRLHALVKTTLSIDRTVLSPGSMRYILQQEQSRADRNSQPLSLAVLSLGAAASLRERVVNTVLDRVRISDQVGWLESDMLGILLPETSTSGAIHVMRDIVKRAGLANDSLVEILTYPDEQARTNGGTKVQEHSWRSGDGDNGEHPASKRSADENDASDRILLSIPPKKSPSFSKRSIDILGSLLGLLIMSPVFLIVAAAIKLSSKGPVFHKQTRLGYLGRPFILWKFRTMRIDSEATIHVDYWKELTTSEKPMTKLDSGSDDRIFRLGRLLRQTCLDELPQLINVLRGEMSLVGPRPCLPYEADNYDNWHWRRLDCLPGMTGLWQVSGKNSTTFRQMVRLDISYAREQSFLLDMKILLKTIPFLIDQARLRHCKPKEQTLDGI